MQHYPLIYGYSDLVMGNGFLASVYVNGRALVEEDSDSVWMIGVSPGGFAASGDNQQLAAVAFRNEFRAVLYDIASSSENFAAFKGAIEKFLSDEQPSLMKQWNDAVEGVRSGDISLEDLPKKDSRRFRPSVRVTCLEPRKAQPENNPLDSQAVLAA